MLAFCLFDEEFFAVDDVDAGLEGVAALSGDVVDAAGGAVGGDFADGGIIECERYGVSVGVEECIYGEWRDFGLAFYSFECHSLGIQQIVAWVEGHRRVGVAHFCRYGALLGCDVAASA